MNGRDFLKSFAGSGLALPFAARAQQAEFARIGALYLGIADEESFKRELREGMREHGYVEGRDIAFEFRSAEGKLDRLPNVAAELVGLNVDVIVALYERGAVLRCRISKVARSIELPVGLMLSVYRGP
jgi:putative tryptophan/tyrosine transport system substrate-binding protein